MPYVGEGSTFFGDQDVLKEDLNNIEYTKTKMVRESVRRTMSQPGVCAPGTESDALKVVKTGTNTFTINPGVAIDGYGRLLVVPQSTAASGSVLTDPYYHPAWPSREDIEHGKTPDTQTVYYVHLKYAVQTGINEVDDAGNSFSTRQYDSYEVVVNQASASQGDSVVLAGLTVDGSTYNISNVVDFRSFYTALTPTVGSLAAHQRTFHSSGIGGSTFPVYTGTSALNAPNQGSLGITINDLAGNKQAVFKDIEDFVNINGTYVTPGLLIDNVLWTSADLAGNYVVYLTKEKSIFRTAVNDFTPASSVNVLPLFHLYWDGNTELTVMSDLRKWNVADTWIGNSQLASGSLTLNSGSMARTLHTNLNFIDDRASLRYDSTGDRFFLSKDLLISSNNLSLDVSGTETSRLYFNRLGKYIYWSGTDQKFFVNDSTTIQGDLQIDSDASLGRNKDNTVTTTLNFNLLSPFDIQLAWDGANQRFDLNKEIRVQGDVKTTSDLYINYGGPDGNSAIFFHEGGSDSGTYLRWEDTLSRFSFSSGAYFDGILDCSNHCRVGGSAYVNYGPDPSTASAIIYFGGTGVNSEVLKWNHATSRFEFTRDLYIEGSVLASTNLVCNGQNVGLNLNGDFNIDTAAIRFGGSVWGGNEPRIVWTPTTGRFEINRGINVDSNDGILTTGHLITNKSLGLNYDGSITEDSSIFFGGSNWGVSPSLAYVGSFVDTENPTGTTGRFIFDRHLKIGGIHYPKLYFQGPAGNQRYIKYNSDGAGDRFEFSTDVFIDEGDLTLGFGRWARFPHQVVMPIQTNPYGDAGGATQGCVRVNPNNGEIYVRNAAGDAWFIHQADSMT